jgi:hypothetical protein
MNLKMKILDCYTFSFTLMYYVLKQLCLVLFTLFNKFRAVMIVGHLNLLLLM